MSSENCRLIADLLVPYDDGELPQDDRLRVEAHLAECAHCRAESVLLRRSLELARAIWAERSAGAGADGVCARRGAGCQPAESKANWQSAPHRRFAMIVAAACAAAAILAIGTWFCIRPEAFFQTNVRRRRGSRPACHLPIVTHRLCPAHRPRCSLMATSRR